jgi:FAD/FMN-containing dehydrogenase/Fe-S oxidoreductase
MDQEQDRVQADLRGVLEGDVHCDDAFVQMYASDASIFQIRPLGVVRPRSTADVVACVQYAAENQIPLHARGAGSGLAGESLGHGLVLDFSYYMRRVIEVGTDRVRVQPGVVLGQLNEQLAEFGRCFGPDPANRAVTTMGSVVAIDAGGSHWLRYGSARQHVDSLKVVLASGKVVQLGKHDVGIGVDGEESGADPHTTKLARGIADLIRANSELIAKHQPRVPVSRCGYRLDDVLRDDRVDLARLLVGSEGTLGLIVEATLLTQELPRHRGVAMLLFDRLENAALAALEIPRMGATACDLLDRRLLRLACESDVNYEQLLPSGTEALLLVEKEGNSPAEVRDGLNQIAHHIRRRRKLAFDARIAIEPDDVELYWRLPQRVVPTLYRLKGSTRPLPFVEDIVVPPSELPGFLVSLQNVLKKHQVTASLFGHVGHGQLHIRPFLDLADPEHLRRMQHLARDLYQEVLDVGGSISGEHGDGLSRTWFLREQFGPLYAVLTQVKNLFDPQQILNPGKIIDHSGQSLLQNLRPVATAGMTAGVTATVAGTHAAFGSETAASDVSQAANATNNSGSGSGGAPVLVDLQLAWDQHELMQTARACNGCGGCRSQLQGERMCPIYRFSPSEEASPRAKANLMRAVLTGQLEPGSLKSDAVKQIADLCVNCHQCRLECPANVDIPRLMIECKAQYVADNGLSVADWFLTRLDTVAAWASLVRPLSNWAIGNRTARWLMEKTLGLAQGRKLPRVAARSFLRQATRRRAARSQRYTGAKVLYFVDTYANWFDPQLAEAFMSVMEHNRITVYVPSDQTQAAMAVITAGSLDRARRIAKHNVALLADAVRQGYKIVATEPSAVLALTREYLALLDDEDALLVSQNTTEACSYLWKLHQGGKLELDLKPINLTVGYHEPCHVRALQDGRTPGANLLRLIPGMVVDEIDAGCSGMAGTFGMKRENYRSSLRAGWGLISAMRSPKLQVGTTECSCCKLQMEQGTAKPTIHPLKLLALAYGLMPEIATQLQTPGEDLVSR